jgi:thioester reductase-like protein
MAYRPVPMHHISTLAALQGEAARQAGRIPEHYDPAKAVPPASGYGRSKWVAERYLAEARRRGATITVLRLGEVMPSEDNAFPNPLALTHLLLSAIHRLGVWPDTTIRSDYTPVDYVAARVVAAVRDRGAWGRTLHIFHPQSVCFAEALSLAGAPVTRTTCGDFLTRLREVARGTGERELARLAALLPAPSAGDEAALRHALRRLLTDNPALFRKDECSRLEQRWRLADGPLHGPITAYRAYLGVAGAGTGMPAGGGPPGAGMRPQMPLACDGTGTP